jgi:hypothetical protein
MKMQISQSVNLVATTIIFYLQPIPILAGNYLCSNSENLKTFYL